MLKSRSRQACRTTNGLLPGSSDGLPELKIAAIPAKTGGSHLTNWIPSVQKYKYNWLSYL